MATMMTMLLEIALHAQLLGPKNRVNYPIYAVCGLTFVYMLFNIPAPRMSMRKGAQRPGSGQAKTSHAAKQSTSMSREKKALSKDE